MSMEEKSQIPPVHYGQDIVGPPPYYTHSQGVPTVMRTETVEVQNEDGIPISTTTTVYMDNAPQMLTFTSNPLQTQCPYCGQQIVTRVDYENGVLTWILAGGLAVVGCWLGCCLIPTCVEGCKDAVHTCPNCNAVLGKYRRL